MKRVVEEPERGGSAKSTIEGSTSDVFSRLYRALGPVLGALLLDFADLATLGPLGLYLGFPIGAAVGWWMSGMYRLKTPGRTVIATLAGVYCMMPATNLLPVATTLSALGRFLEDPRQADPKEGESGA